jgi:hypothetical protein
MAKSIDGAFAEVEDAWSKVRLLPDEAAGSLWTFERELWTRMLALGRALMALFLARRAWALRSSVYQRGGATYELVEERTSELGTRFGKVSFTRPVGRRRNRPKEAADLVVDRELGLGGGFSLGVMMAVTRLCAQMAFAGARDTFRETYEWTPSPRATLRMVDAAGGEARAFLEQAAPPDDDARSWSSRSMPKERR